jgi:hypothetical protein
MSNHVPPDTEVREIQVPQNQDTSIQQRAEGSFRLRYLYARSSDTKRAGELGQDYIAVRYDLRRLAFALCDGVSQSFYGDLAARFLGDALMEWLWDTATPGEFGKQDIQELLGAYLLELIPEATELVQAVVLPEGTPPLLHEVLEQKRSMGSETTFVCGSVEMPGPDLPAGRLILAWMGDSELQLWGSEGDRTCQLGAEWTDQRRWSTRVGPKGGSIGLYVDSLHDAHRIIVYSDGLASLRERLGQGLHNKEIEAAVESLARTPTNDDMSFLEIETLPEPGSTSVLASEPQARL